jgi:hypothetical protein
MWVKPLTINCSYEVINHCLTYLLYSYFKVHEWAWDEQLATATTLLSNDNREVQFHPGYSSGTAAIRGDSPFQRGHIYYWEIKMLTALYGTDVVSLIFQIG